jgi:DNA gyrase subunit A
MSAAEQFILTISEHGYGKRTSSHEYRITGRGGKGIVAMSVSKRNGPLVASFPVDDADQIMLVTNGGQVIRVPVDTGPDNRIRIVSRSSQGVTIFNTAEGEKVVSVERIVEPEGEEGDAEDEAPEDGAAE